MFVRRKCYIQIFFVILIIVCFSDNSSKNKKRSYSSCLRATLCLHNTKRVCGLEPKTREVRWFLNKCDIHEFNCEYGTIIFIACLFLEPVTLHGPPQERDNEDIAMGRKMSPKWCNLAKMCNHDRVPVCGVSHAGDIVGFRDFCDMFDYNCIRRRNYKQTACPEDKSMLTVSRRPTNNFYDDK